MNKKVYGNAQKLINEGSELHTTASLYIDVHYLHMGLPSRWSWERYKRLCMLLGLMPAELASLAIMPHSWLKRYEETAAMPTNRDQALRQHIGLTLTLIEAHCVSHLIPDAFKNPFPDLTDLKKRLPKAFQKPSSHGPPKDP